MISLPLPPPLLLTVTRWQRWTADDGSTKSAVSLCVCMLARQHSSTAAAYGPQLYSDGPKHDSDKFTISAQPAVPTFDRCSHFFLLLYKSHLVVAPLPPSQHPPSQPHRASSPHPTPQQPPHHTCPPHQPPPRSAPQAPRRLPLLASHLVCAIKKKVIKKSSQHPARSTRDDRRLSVAGRPAATRPTTNDTNEK
ncbi:hypothetical protein HDK64DRAFT_284210 [Phyllosticta capitalensis]